LKESAMVTDTIPPRAPGRPAGSGRWIPWIFVAAMAVVVAVNAVFIVVAVTTWSGLSVDRAYDRGLAYNRVIAAAARQDRLGWTMRAAFVPARPGGRDGTIEILLADRAGAPVDDLVFDARLERPVERRAAIPLALAGLGGGRYAATVTVPAPGQWELVVDGRRSDGRYLVRHRIVLP